MVDFSSSLGTSVTNGSMFLYFPFLIVQGDSKKNNIFTVQCFSQSFINTGSDSSAEGLEFEPWLNQ